MKTFHEQRLDTTNAEIDMKLIEKYSSQKSMQTVLLYSKNNGNIPKKDFSSELKFYQNKMREKIK